MKTPRIVIDARGLRGTTGRLHREYLTQLEKIDQQTDFHVIITEDDQGAWVPSNKNITMHVVKWKFYRFGEQLGYAWFLYSLKADLVHFMWPQQPLLYFGKRISNVHDLTLLRFENIDKNRYIYKFEKFVFRLLLWNVVRRSSRILVISNYVKNDVLGFSKINPDKVIVAHCAASQLQHRRPMPIQKLANTQFVFYVGNAFPHKNLERLIDAVDILRQKHPHLALVIAGRKDYFHTQLEQYADNRAHIHILGFVEEGELAWLYNHAQAYIFPSLSEGFGLPGLEAMQHGLPLVSSNSTCLPEIYGAAAHYFDPLSASDMSRAIDEVLRSKQRREKLIANGYKQLEKFSWLKMARITHKQYFRVLK